MPDPTADRPPRRGVGARMAGLALAVGLAVVPLAPASSALAAPGDPTEYSPEFCQSYNATSTRNLPASVWQVDRLRYADLHTMATGRGVTVAVIDTGVGVGTGPQLADADITVVDEIGVEGISNGRFDCRHGTVVVSLLASRPDATPGSDFAGIAPDVSVIAYRALAETASSTGQPQPLTPVVDAINDAVDRRVDIISISQQGDDTSGYSRAIRRAVDAGILVVAAAGNDGPGAGPAYPAAYPGVMAVGMTNQADEIAAQSQSGEGMTVSVAAPGDRLWAALPQCAPGENECSTDDDSPGALTNSEEFTTGTSFATPLVAGAAALLMERYPDLTAAQVKQRLEETADPPPGGGVDERIGHGIINPYRALNGPAVATPPSAEPSVVGNERIQPPPDTTDYGTRTTGLAIAGISVAVVLVAAAVIAAVPAGRRRRWRAAQRSR